MSPIDRRATVILSLNTIETKARPPGLVLGGLKLNY